MRLIPVSESSNSTGNNFRRALLCSLNFVLGSLDLFSELDELVWVEGDRRTNQSDIPPIFIRYVQVRFHWSEHTSLDNAHTSM